MGSLIPDRSAQFPRFNRRTGIKFSIDKSSGIPLKAHRISRMSQALHTQYQDLRSVTEQTTQEPDHDSLESVSPGFLSPLVSRSLR